MDSICVNIRHYCLDCDYIIISGNYFKIIQMIKIKIYELDKHRNETTFRPYLQHIDMLRVVGIDITNGDSYDYAWVGQASISDKLLPLDESVEKGLEFCENITGDFMIFDGQDSHSLIGVYELFKRAISESNGRCKLLLKNTLLRSFEMYKTPTVNGRWYWGEGEYSNPDIDFYKDRIALSGTNWLSTCSVDFKHLGTFNKYRDVCAIFGYNLEHGIEHGLEHHKHYNAHRKRCVDQLLSVSGVDMNILPSGTRLGPRSYYEMMYSSKVVIAPFGYGEMMPRDIETMAMGSILIKPTMDHLVSEPWIYDEGKTYIGCRHDYSDLPEKIDFVLSNFKSLQKEMHEYAEYKFRKSYNNPIRLPRYLYGLFMDKLKNELVTYED
jgi:hypothetical protein